MTPTFKSHVSVAPPPAKHPFNNPSTGLMSTRCPGSPLQVSTLIARGSDHLLDDSAPNVKSLRCFRCAICATNDRCPVEAQLLAILKTNFFLFPLKAVCAGWKLPRAANPTRTGKLETPERIGITRGTYSPAACIATCLCQPGTGSQP